MGSPESDPTNGLSDYLVTPDDAEEVDDTALVLFSNMIGFGNDPEDLAAARELLRPRSNEPKLSEETPTNTPQNTEQ